MPAASFHMYRYDMPTWIESSSRLSSELESDHFCYGNLCGVMLVVVEQHYNHDSRFRLSSSGYMISYHLVDPEYGSVPLDLVIGGQGMRGWVAPHVYSDTEHI